MRGRWIFSDIARISLRRRVSLICLFATARTRIYRCCGGASFARPLIARTMGNLCKRGPDASDPGHIALEDEGSRNGVAGGGVEGKGQPAGLLVGTGANSSAGAGGGGGGGAGAGGARQPSSPLQPADLPEGWKAAVSRSRPGKMAYVNLHTGERISWVPTEPAPTVKGQIKRKKKKRKKKGKKKPCHEPRADGAGAGVEVVELVEHTQV